MSLYDRYALKSPPEVNLDGEYHLELNLEHGEVLCQVEVEGGAIVRIEDLEEGQQIIPATLPQCEVDRIFRRIQ